MEFAFWRKCDLQVHTPRDPNWQGQRPPGLGDILEDTGSPASAEDVEIARDNWASEFVNKCADKGLEVIGVTDHHEMVMVPYIEKAIAARKESGPDFDLWLFPGMELTAAGGVQCLILFDGDLSEDWRRQAQGKLGIVYADLDEKARQAPAVTQLTANYADIGSLLDELEGIRGKYIVLPNVSQGGGHTVMRAGAHADFLRMPYVGAYLDRGQTIDTLANNRQRLSGTDKNWSTRCIYPIPTSDSRSADYAHLGTNNAWIKLSAPTCESVRQAFLGHPSRIAIDTPAIPSLSVSGIKVEGSDILEPFDMRLSPELNAIIGGRGSGKSSFLEYLSFGLGRSCHDFSREDFSGSDRLSELVKDTLIANGGTVEMIVRQDGAPFKIVRGPASTHQPEITYPNGSSQSVSLKELRSLFPAVVYSQGELAEIGKQTGARAQLSDLLQFVNTDYKKEDDRLLQEIKIARTSVMASIQALVEHWGLQSKKHKLEATRDALLQRVQALEKSLPEQSAEDQAAIEAFEKASEFEAKRIQASKHAVHTLGDLKALNAEHGPVRDVGSDLPGAVVNFREAYSGFHEGFTDGISQLIGEMEARHSTLVGAETAWAAEFAQKRGGRDAALEKLGEHKTVTAQIIKLREEVGAIVNQIGDLDSALNGAGDAAGSYTQSLDELKQATGNRAQRANEWAQEIGTLSSGKIKAVVHDYGDISEIMEAIDLVAAKTGSQEATRIREINKALEDEDVWSLVSRVRSDCLAILYWAALGSAIGEEFPASTNLLGILGDTDRIRKALTELLDLQRVQAISTAIPKPHVSLFYCDGAKEIAFEKASEGQRAAALLFMLLEQQGGPLIVDQPEGDLDNRIISDLTEKLHNAKSKRQIIFASHNANIVVNGSSELVAHLDVDADGKRQFECSGAIDNAKVRELITSTMEGGEKAFKDRQDKYGY